MWVCGGGLGGGKPRRGGSEAGVVCAVVGIEIGAVTVAGGVQGAGPHLYLTRQVS